MNLKSSRREEEGYYGTGWPGWSSESHEKDGEQNRSENFRLSKAESSGSSVHSDSSESGRDSIGGGRAGESNPVEEKAVVAELRGIVDTKPGKSVSG